MVVAAGSDTSRSGPALEKLCRKYWQPLYGHARRSRLDREASEDAVQGFLLTVIQRSSLGGVEPGEGRFRSWLLGGFSNFLASLLRREYTVKRGGGIAPVAFDGIEDAERLLPASEGLDPAEAFDQNWARLMLDNAISRLRSEQVQAGKAELYAELEPLVTGQVKTPYAELSARCGVAEKNLAVLIHRLRQRLRDILRADVAQIVTTAEALDDELRYLMDLVRRAG